MTAAPGFKTQSLKRDTRSYEKHSAPENRIGRASFSAAQAHIACPTASDNSGLDHGQTPRHRRTSGPTSHEHGGHHVV